MDIKLNLLPSLDIERVDSEEGRYYKIGESDRYDSVTQFVSTLFDDSWLKEWKERKGEDHTKRVLTQAGNRGSAVHRIAENYILGNEYKKGEMPVNLESFSPIKRVIDENITEVYGVEHMLYSHKMKLAGTSDLIAKWKDKPVIADFKTAKYIKKEKDIINYFLQSTIYAMMVNEHYDLTIRDIVIIMKVDHEKDCLVFEKKIDKFEKVINKVLNI